MQMKKSWQMLLQERELMKVYWYQNWNVWWMVQFPSKLLQQLSSLPAIYSQALSWRRITLLWWLEHLLWPQKLITPWTSRQGQFVKCVPMLKCHSCAPLCAYVSDHMTMNTRALCHIYQWDLNFNNFGISNNRTYKLFFWSILIELKWIPFTHSTFHVALSYYYFLVQFSHVFIVTVAGNIIWLLSCSVWNKQLQDSFLLHSSLKIICTIHTYISYMHNNISIGTAPVTHLCVKPCFNRIISLKIKQKPHAFICHTKWLYYNQNFSLQFPYLNIKI